MSKKTADLNIIQLLRVVPPEGPRLEDEVKLNDFPQRFNGEILATVRGPARAIHRAEPKLKTLPTKSSAKSTVGSICPIYHTDRQDFTRLQTH